MSLFTVPHTDADLVEEEGAIRAIVRACWSAAAIVIVASVGVLVLLALTAGRS